MLLKHKKICIGSDIRSLLYSHFNNYYFIPYQYFYSIPCDYYRNIDFLFSNSKVLNKLRKTIIHNGTPEEVVLKSDVEDVVFNIMGQNGRILSFKELYSYEFCDLNRIKLKFEMLECNIFLEYEECLLIDPIYADDLVFFESEPVEENRNSVFMFYQLKNDKTFYRNYDKYNHIYDTKFTFPQKISYGDYKKLDFKYCILSGVVTDSQLSNDVLFHENRLLEYSITNLVGEKEFKKNGTREKQFAKYIGKTVVPFTRIKYKDTSDVKFLYPTEDSIVDSAREINDRNISTTKII